MYFWKAYQNNTTQLLETKGVPILCQWLLSILEYAFNKL